MVGMVYGMRDSSDIYDPEVATQADVELLRDGCLDERHLPQGLTWEELVKMVKRELPAMWRLMVLEHQQRTLVSAG